MQISAYAYMHYMLYIKGDFHDIADAATIVNYMYSNVCDSGVLNC